MKIQKSAEDYLETILILYNRRGTVHAIDIANELNYSKASISRAVGLLKNNGFINVDQNGYITFTGPGLQQAEAIYDRHTTIKQFFIDVLNVSEENAEQDACKIEHILSDESYEKLKNFKK